MYICVSQKMNNMFQMGAHFSIDWINLKDLQSGHWRYDIWLFFYHNIRHCCSHNQQLSSPGSKMISSRLPYPSHLNPLTKIMGDLDVAINKPVISLSAFKSPTSFVGKDPHTLVLLYQTSKEDCVELYFLSN